MSFTQLPDFIIDECKLTPIELACLVLISRKTVGWGKRTDGISYSQFVDALGVSKNTIIKALRSLETKGLIVIESSLSASGGHSFNRYSFSDLVVDKANIGRIGGSKSERGVVQEMNKGSSANEQGVVQEMNKGSSANEQGLVQNLNTQDKANTKQTRQDKNPLSAEAESLVSLWIETMGKSRISDKRKKDLQALVNRKLKDFSHQELSNAILGCAKSDYHMGNNPNGKKYNDLELIFRNSQKIENFADLMIDFEKPVKPNRHSGFAQKDYHAGVSADGRF